MGGPGFIGILRLRPARAPDFAQDDDCFVIGTTGT
jgi:hypothetical protein